MNLNRSVLQRKYYIIVSYEPAEMGITNTFSKEEAKDVAYAGETIIKKSELDGRMETYGTSMLELWRCVLLHISM